MQIGISDKTGSLTLTDNNPVADSGEAGIFAELLALADTSRTGAIRSPGVNSLGAEQSPGDNSVAGGPFFFGQQSPGFPPITGAPRPAPGAGGLPVASATNPVTGMKPSFSPVDASNPGPGKTAVPAGQPPGGQVAGLEKGQLSQLQTAFSFLEGGLPPEGASELAPALRPAPGSETGNSLARNGKSAAVKTGSGAETSSVSALLSSGTDATRQTALSSPAVKAAGFPQAQTALTPAVQTEPALPGQDLDVSPDGPDLSAEPDVGATLKPDLKSAEQALTQQTRSLSHTHMAAVVSRVSEQFLERFNGKTSTFEIRLDPPELGKVDIRVEVGADGKVMAVIAARDPAVAEALMRGAKTLENALTQAGLNLSDGGIQVQLDQKQGSGFAGTRGDEFAGSKPGSLVPDADPLAEAGDDTTLVPLIESWSRRRLDVTA